ncbi:hypothetical protein [Erwinia aphidicola]|uniref:hypothetical protein n=1 Tax=Erwinia aphidicola TaxID=68334 RepID=UPI0030193FEF
MAADKKIKLHLANHVKNAFGYLSNNPHLALSSLLFIFGATLISTKASMVAGALFGAGASLLGAWVTEFNTKRSREQERIKKESEARKYLAPELRRIIERTLHIHSKAIGSVQASSAFDVYAATTPSENIPPDMKQYIFRDLMEDMNPYLPVLYPNVEQFKHLTNLDAVSLISFYDSLNELDAIIKGWWEREARLSVNIYYPIAYKSSKSLEFAIKCVETFNLDTQFPNTPLLSTRIMDSLSKNKIALDSMHKAESAITENFPKPTSKAR